MTRVMLVQVVLAADVLYDDTMTDSLCHFLCAYLQAASTQRGLRHSEGDAKVGTASGYRGAAHGLGCDGPCTPHTPRASDEPLCPAAVLRRCYERPTVILAAEKRYVFTIDDADVRAPAFEHFLSHVRLTGGGSEVSLSAQGGDGATRRQGEITAEGGLVGRFLPTSDVDRAVGGLERSQDLVLVELWLDAGS